MNKRTIVKRNLFVNALSMALIYATMGFSYTITGASAPAGLNGVPIGGIGTGKFMLTPAGTFTQVTLDGDVIHSANGGYVANTATTFLAVYAKSTATWASKLTTAAGMGINYTGYFPKATITYTNASMPIALTLEAFSPFIPGNKDAYSLPAGIFVFTLKNNTAASVDAAVAFSWQGSKTLSGTTNLLNGSAISGVKGSFIGGDYSLMVKNDGAGTTSCGSNYADFSANGAFNNAPSGSVIGVASKVTLAAGEQRKITIVFGWDIPSYALSGSTNDQIGHWHDNKFTGSNQVAQYALDSADAFLSGVNKWQNRILNSSLPGFLKDMLCNNMYILNTLVCLGKDGRYSMSEGLGYTWMGTLDQRFVGTLPVLVFAKDCEYSEMKLFAAHQDANGQIWHDLGNKSLSAGCGYGCQMVELSSKFVLMVYRNYMWTGNRDSLTYYWPKVKAALQCQKNRADATSLMLTTGQQTYDCTIFASAYANGIWCASLLAGAELAKVMGDNTSATTYTNWYNTVKASYEGLWNSQYGFYQMETGDATCMYDQLTGQMYADMLSLGKMHPVAHIQAAAQYIPTRLGDTYGLKNGLRPDGSYPTGICCGGEPNCTWPGYPTAGYCAMAIYNGNTDLGLQWLYNIYNGIYNVNKVVWHQECKQYTNNGQFYEGNIHYMNLMAVWHNLYALTGLNIDVAGKRLWVQPNLPTKTDYMSNDSLVAPIAFPTTWGDLVYKQGATPNDQHISLTLDNPLQFNTITVRNTNASPTVTVYKGGVAMPCTQQKNGDNLALQFASPITVDNNAVEIVMPAGASSTIPVGNVVSRKPADFSVAASANHGFRILYNIYKSTYVHLDVFNMKGELAGALVNGFKNPGFYSVEWTGASHPAGIYIFKLTGNDNVSTHKVILTR